MAISMRALFSRRSIAFKGTTEVISLRTSLANHQFVPASLLAAGQRLRTINDGDGLARGCRRPDEIEIGIPGIGGFNVAKVLPAWIPATLDPSDHRSRPMTVEGLVTKSRVTSTDFPLKPWHLNYDWNIFVFVDPQYEYLLSPAVLGHDDGSLECEWDTEGAPLWALPQPGDRVWMVGRWIYDCGHFNESGPGHRTEIHPPKAIASFRSEAASFPGNGGPTRANKAFVFIGRRGGYIDQSINDQDYEFDLYLPPKPHADAVPTMLVEHVLGPSSIRPQMTAVPDVDPRAWRVVIPFKGVSSDVKDYGVIISGGWSDPSGTETQKVRRLRVRLDKLQFDGFGGGRLYVGVNGRWQLVTQLLADIDLDTSVDLMLHQDDNVHVTACGFRAENIDAFMGRSSGVPLSVISQRNTRQEAKKAAGRIRDAFIKGAIDPRDIPRSFGNDPLRLLSRKHPAKVQGSFRGAPQGEGKKYELHYTIQEV
jgi:hypothetical protein